jgi:AbiV family abortive infection protein
MADLDAIIPLIKACLSNAESLLDSAKEISKPGRNHVSYHLAALALEEIGKASILIVRSARPFSKEEGDADDEESRVSGWLEDHERKLFWALWAPSIGMGNVSVEQFRELQRVAKEIHELRLASLYVNPTDQTAQAEVSDRNLQTLIGLAEARLNMEKLIEFRQLDLAKQKIIDWFSDAMGDPQLRGLIVSGGSLSKLAEFTGDSNKWITWLQEQISEMNVKNQELLERELQRSELGGQGSSIPKWRWKVRFHSLSHSTRPKQLVAWNNQSKWIKLFPTNDKKELLVQFTGPSHISIQAVWQTGLQMSSMFLVALNIATSGYYWWYLPQFVSKYYEEIFDIGNKAPLVIERSPPLTVSLVRHALKENQLINAGLVFVHMIQLGPEKGVAYARYARGLALLAKNDMFGQFEANILVEFFEAFRAGLIAYGDWDGIPATFACSIEQVLNEIVNTPEIAGEFKRLLEVASTIESQKSATQSVSLDETFKLKAWCDIYLFTRARREVTKKEGRKDGGKDGA